MLLLLMSRKQKSGMYKKCKVGGGGCARGGGISLLLTTTRDLNHRSASAGTDQPASLQLYSYLLSLSRRTPCHTTHHSAPLLSSIFNLPQPHEQHAEPLNASPSDLRRER